MSTPLRIKTGVKAGNDGLRLNHNETQLRWPLRINTGVEAGGWELNHKQRHLAADHPKITCCSEGPEALAA